MTTVVDLFTRQAVSLKRSALELAQLGRATEAPDFVKKSGRMVLTDETREETLQLFQAFGLQGAEDMSPDTMLNTWAWLGSKVSTALLCVDRGDFDSRIRPNYPADYCAYVLALAAGEQDAITRTAAALNVLHGMADGHPLLADLEL